jgi:L-asparaginase / beta-aspartyl-peptidase
MKQSARIAKTAFSDVVLAIHGGAGVMTRQNMTATNERNYLKKLEAALKAGYKALQKTGNSLDAVEAAVRFLEDCPLFNAGRGAVFTHDGRIELDASIMDGSTKCAGAVAAVTNVQNPISAARAVMECSEHVLLVGKGAEKFAKRQGLKIVAPSYFWTQRQWDRFELAISKSKDDEDAPRKTCRPAVTKKRSAKRKMDKFGTVGAVARDQSGNLTAATSTGGTMNKEYGRVGDSPIIGAGIYADNQTCAVSCTGHGEYFMRFVAAHEIASLMRYKNLSLAEAADTVIHEMLYPAGGMGGVISLDGEGNCAMPFNTEGMFRGCITADGEIDVSIYR